MDETQQLDSLLLTPLQRMTAQERIAEICRILATGLLRARAKGKLPVATSAPPKARATPTRASRRRGWAGSRVV